MTKHYELTILTDDSIDQRLAMSKVDAVLKFVGAETTKYEDEGRKRLAYAIRGHEYANYHYYNIIIDESCIAKLSSWLDINDDVLRYLLVEVSPKIKAQYKIEKAITDWVEDNYGESKAEEHRQGIEELSHYLNNELKVYKGEE